MAPRRGGRLSAVLGAAALLAAIAAPARAAADDPAARAQAAFARLASDLVALPAGGVRTQLVGAASAARLRLLAGAPCEAIARVRALRVAARAALPAETPSTRARLEADALGLEAALLQRADTGACGGGAVVAAPGLRELRLLGASRRAVRVRVLLPAARLTGLDGAGTAYVRLAMAGMGLRGTPGSPALPARTERLAIPRGARLAARVVATSGYDLPDVLLAPRAREAVDAGPFDDPPFQLDAAAYARAGAEPAQPVAVRPLGRMRDIAVGGLELDGATYDAAARTLHVVTQIEVEVTFAGGGTFGRRDAISPWNRAAVPAYAGLVNWQAAAGQLEPVALPDCGVELMIITSPALRPAADELAAARRAAGFSTSVGEVGSGPKQLGTTASAIQRAIRRQLAALCVRRPSYVAIVGDVDEVPTFLVPTPDALTGWDGLIATDNPYGLADDADLLPDLAVGRIPARTLQHARIAVRKIVGYETAGPADAAFYRNATVTSYFQADTYADDSPHRYDARGFTLTSETIARALEAERKTVDRVYVADATSHPTYYLDGTAMPPSLRWPSTIWNGTGADVMAGWSAGRFLVIHRDHGAPDAWGSPDVLIRDVAALRNGALLPVVLAINCASGMFDAAEQSIVERMVMQRGGGAVGAIADSRNSNTSANDQLALGLVDAMFPRTLPGVGPTTAIRRMGDVLVAGKAYMATQTGVLYQDAGATESELSLYQWFGDPTMEIRTSASPAFPLGRDLVAFRHGRLELRRGRIPRGSWVTALRDGRPVARGRLTGQRLRLAATRRPGSELRLVVEAPGGRSRSLRIR